MEPAQSMSEARALMRSIAGAHFNIRKPSPPANKQTNTCSKSPSCWLQVTRAVND